jgi:hypothetical protein
MSYEFITIVLLDVVRRIHWGEALKGWWLEAHARALRRGDLPYLAAPRPAPAPEPPPRYDAALHVQMQADIARFSGVIGRSMAGTDDHQGPRRRHALSSPMAEGTAPERDLAYLVQMRAQGDAPGSGGVVARPGVMPRRGRRRRLGRCGRPIVSIGA